MSNDVPLDEVLENDAIMKSMSDDDDHSDYVAHSDLETSSFRSSTRDSFEDDDPNFNRDSDEIVSSFRKWTQKRQILYIQKLLKHMNHSQVGKINNFLRPMLMRDFISELSFRGHSFIAERILLCLDAESLKSASLVSSVWHKTISEGYVWLRLIEAKVNSDSFWYGIVKRACLMRYMRSSSLLQDRAAGQCSMEFGASSTSSYHISNNVHQIFQSNNNNSNINNSDATNSVENDNFVLMPAEFYATMYSFILKQIKRVEQNWFDGKYNLKKIVCNCEISKGVYCLQYDDDRIICGLRDNTIKIYNFKNLQCVKTLFGHTGSVLCLQYDEHVIVSGSSDATVRVWMINTFECVNVVYHHVEAVLHLRFNCGTLVTCSKDRSIAVWNMTTPTSISLKQVLVGHKAAVNVVDFDNKYIVSASGDRTIKVWNTQTCEPIRTLSGHKRGIACLQYRDTLIVSGSSDNTIRLWYIECGTCIRVLEGHLELVRCIRFNNKYIVSGSYDGEIKIWDLISALNPRVPAMNLCINTLNKHTGRVFRLQFDEFKIVSSSHDDSILIWDFLKPADGNHAGPINNDSFLKCLQERYELHQQS